MGMPTRENLDLVKQARTAVPQGRPHCPPSTNHLAGKPGSSSRCTSFLHLLTLPDMIARLASESRVIMSGQVRRCKKVNKTALGDRSSGYKPSGRSDGWIRLIVGFQPLMVISPTASWIRWCMQAYAWWVNVDLSCLGWTIYARQFFGAKPPIQFRHRWAQRNHSDHLYRLRAAQSDA